MLPPQISTSIEEPSTLLVCALGDGQRVDARFAEEHKLATIDNLRAQTTHYGQGGDSGISPSLAYRIGRDERLDERSSQERKLSLLADGMKAFHSDRPELASLYFSQLPGGADILGRSDSYMGGLIGGNPQINTAALIRAARSSSELPAARGQSEGGFSEGELSILERIPSEIQSARAAVDYLVKNFNFTQDRAEALVRADLEEPSAGTPSRPPRFDWSSKAAFARSAARAGIPKEEARQMWADRNGR